MADEYSKPHYNRKLSISEEYNWESLKGVKGDIYEKLLEQNAQDVKSGAGQYFTPSPLIRAMVECLRPQPMKTIADTACGIGVG
jgi:type I restriction enzyme M protein